MEAILADPESLPEDLDYASVRLTEIDLELAMFGEQEAAAQAEMDALREQQAQIAADKLEAER